MVEDPNTADLHGKVRGHASDLDLGAGQFLMVTVDQAQLLDLFKITRRDPFFLVVIFLLLSLSLSFFVWLTIALFLRLLFLLHWSFNLLFGAFLISFGLLFSTFVVVLVRRLRVGFGTAGQIEASNADWLGQLQLGSIFWQRCFLDQTTD